MKIVHSSEKEIKESDLSLVKILPKAPSFWDTPTKNNYKSVGALLIKAKLLKETHLPILKILAGQLSQIESAERAIFKKNKAADMSGYIQKFSTGASQLSPEVTLREKAIKQAFICFKRFGLDPKSEKELQGAVVDPGQTNLLDALLGSKSS
jgi:phage terminase small subunit